MITYRTGDATAPVGDGQKIIAHVVNNARKWGEGFVMSLSARWPEPEASYLQWPDFTKNKFLLGNIAVVRVTADIQVANMLAQQGLRSRTNPFPFKLEALSGCLFMLNGWAKTHNASVHMPRIGCGLGRGRWEEIEPLINANLPDIAVTVYDLP